MSKNKGGEEVTFATRGLTLRGKRWGKGGKQKVLALHGWMDNCHSFLPVAEYLRQDAEFLDLDLVAPDLAGHGLSAHRSADSAYNIWQDIAEIDEVLQQLAWDRVTILGHSRGAMLATLYAGTLPNRVEQLIVLDGFVPQPIPEAEAPAQLAAAIRDSKRLSGLPVRYYSNREEALKARIQGRLKLSEEAADCFAERGLLRNKHGFYWCGDRRVYGASEVKLSKGQVIAFVNTCRCPIHIIVRKDWETLFKTNLSDLSLTADIHLTAMEGSHHLHMDNNTIETVSFKIKELLENFNLNS